MKQSQSNTYLPYLPINYLLTQRFIKVRNAAAELLRLFHPTLDPAHVVRVDRTYVQVTFVREPAAPLFGCQILYLGLAVYAEGGHVQRLVETLRGRVNAASHVRDLVR